MENQIETREISVDFSEPMTFEITRMEINIIKDKLKNKHKRSKKTGGEILRGLVRKGYQFEGVTSLKLIPSGSVMKIMASSVFGEIAFRIDRTFELPTDSLFPCGNKRIEWVNSINVLSFNESGDNLSMMEIEKFTEIGGAKAILRVNRYGNVKLRVNLHPRF